MRDRARRIQDMLGRRARGNRFGSAVRARTVVPRIAGGENENQPSGTESRREFLARFGLGLAGVAAVLAGIPLLGALFSTPERRGRTWHAVGGIDEFPIDETVRVEFTDPDDLPWSGPAARSAAWLRRIGDDDFTAFSVYCTHTGCPVSWRSGANLFICPCHGGVFDREGEVLSGPPERPLVRLNVRIREQQVEILSSGIPVTGEIQ